VKYPITYDARKLKQFTQYLASKVTTVFHPGCSRFLHPYRGEIPNGIKAEVIPVLNSYAIKAWWYRSTHS